MIQPRPSLLPPSASAADILATATDLMATTELQFHEDADCAAALADVLWLTGDRRLIEATLAILYARTACLDLPRRR